MHKSAYDYLIVGAGIYGAVFAREAADKGKKCLVIDKRPYIGGNAYTYLTEGIHVHKYGPHIFHTSEPNIWEYVNKYAEWNAFVNSPLAYYKGKIYNMPINMNTFNELWNITVPSAAKAKIEKERLKITCPQNLEEQALSLVGREIYEIFIKGYTEKQWDRKCADLPAFIIKRLPFRYTFDNNYYNDRFQGIPVNGYTAFIKNLLDGIEIRLNTPFIHNDISTKKIVYTGCIDEFFNYRLGALEYRSLRFTDEIFESENVQGNAVINYTSADELFTRRIEHRHFDRNCKSLKSIISTEYSVQWKIGDEPYYPVNDDKNNGMYSAYAHLAKLEDNVIFGGRLGTYAYLDMDKVIAAALQMAKIELS